MHSENKYTANPGSLEFPQSPPRSEVRKKQAGEGSHDAGGEGGYGKSGKSEAG